MHDTPLWHDAAAFAARAHEHQLRKDGATPYAAHPARVAMIVATLFGCADETVLAAAWLHDVIEDTDVDYDEIAERFGADVADLVAVLTKDMRLVEPTRERAYDDQLAAGPWEGRLIKLADVYDNLRDATTEASRRKLLEKARRALDLAAGEPRLATACGAVRGLVEATARELEQTTRS